MGHANLASWTRVTAVGCDATLASCGSGAFTFTCDFIDNHALFLPTIECRSEWFLRISAWRLLTRCSSLNVSVPTATLDCLEEAGRKTAQQPCFAGLCVSFTSCPPHPPFRFPPSCRSRQGLGLDASLPSPAFQLVCLLCHCITSSSRIKLGVGLDPEPQSFNDRWADHGQARRRSFTGT
ncbi:hypothetical protein VTI74DRAFT_890 [Chaetomium olivicolor]